jgi:hypothetical protein
LLYSFFPVFILDKCGCIWTLIKCFCILYGQEVHDTGTSVTSQSGTTGLRSSPVASSSSSIPVCTPKEETTATPTCATPCSSQSPRRVLSPCKRVQMNIFGSKDDWLQYLRENAKSAAAMQLLDGGQYSKKARIEITQVTVSKLIEQYGKNPTSTEKLKISAWLGELTHMAATDFFDAQTHKGYLNKALQNHRLKLHGRHNDRSQKNKDKKLPVKRSELVLACDPASEADLLNRDGCLRNVIQCEFCQGNRCQPDFDVLVL